MPRITGPDIATHVAHQEAAVVEAATRLFAERGYDRVSLGDIAAEVGLARTSLYRYFPDKGHILLAWMRRDMGALVERCEEIAADRGRRPHAEDRLRAWIDVQLEMLSDPGHVGVMALTATGDDLHPEVRAELSAQHTRLYATVERIVADAIGSRPGSVRTAHTAAFVTALLRTAGELSARTGDPQRVHDELVGAALAVVHEAAGGVSAARASR